MFKPKIFFLAPSLRTFRRVILLTGLAIIPSACAAPGASKTVVADNGIRVGNGFVRLEPIEPGAPDNAHPFIVSVGGLQQMLAKLKVKGTVSGDPQPVFTSAELVEYSSHLVAALAKAGPKEDVTFATAGSRGIFGAYSPKSFTTGRIFVRDAQLNIIFGTVHERNDSGQMGVGAARSITPGTRKQKLESGWSMMPDGARVADQRPDWVLIDTTAIPVAASPLPSVAPVSTESSIQEIEDKLRLLEQLKTKGLITEEEYGERRRSILQRI